MALWSRRRRKSARALIVRDGHLLVFHRKRHSRKTGEWIEYYSIPGGGIDRGETAEHAAVRELKEEMGIDIALGPMVAHAISRKFEHFVFSADIINGGVPTFQLDSEEAIKTSEKNQFIVEWVPINTLTAENLRYYGCYLELLQRLAAGEIIHDVVELDVR